MDSEPASTAVGAAAEDRARSSRSSFDPRKRLEREIGGLFDQLFSPMHPGRSMRGPHAWHPFTDVYEDEARFIIRMELAGIDVDSLALEKDGRCLIVRGNRPDPFRGGSHACHQLEISHGAFERVICLPTDFREDSVHPEYTRSAGFLTITVDKETT